MARRRHLKITVEGKAYDVVVEDMDENEDEGTLYPSPNLTSIANPARPAPAAASSPSPAAPSKAPAAGASELDKLAPLGGVILEINVKEGDGVKTGDQILTIEAMKMKQAVSAHRDGTVRKIHVEAGQVVDAGQPLMTIE